MIKKNKKGFTLIELLVVISIIGILVIVAVPALFKNIERAKAVTCLSNRGKIKTQIVIAVSEDSSADRDKIAKDVINDTEGKYFETKAVCKSGGEYTAKFDDNYDKITGENGGAKVYVTCNIHRDSVEEAMDIYESMANLIDKFKDDSSIIPGSSKSNDQFRKYLLDNKYKDGWPKVPDEFKTKYKLDKDTLYIQPYAYNPNKENSTVTVYASKNRGLDSDSRNWNTNLVYDYEKGVWYKIKGGVSVANKNWETLKEEIFKRSDWEILD